MGDVIEQAADRIDSTWTFEGHDPGEDRPAIQIARALAEAGLLRSDAEQAVIAAAEAWQAASAALEDAHAARLFGGADWARCHAAEARRDAAFDALASAVAALRAARKETP